MSGAARVWFAASAAVLLRRRRNRHARRKRSRGPSYSRISRRALSAPGMSAFQYLYGSGCNASMVTLTGFDYIRFRRLLLLFQPLYDKFTPYYKSGMIKVKPSTTKGRPRSMDATQCLALYLAWGRTRGSQMVITLIFGVTASVASLFIRFARHLIIKALVTHEDARIRLSTDEEVRDYQRAVSSKYPRLPTVCAMMDGLKLRLEASGQYEIQNMFYNGWTHDHYVTNILVFAPDGRIVACGLNAPGCLHDSLVADWSGVYDKLEGLHRRTGAQVVVDSAFSSGDYPFLIKCGSLADVAGQATQLRQAAEWGMRAIQSAFPRLKDRLDYEEMGERRFILLATVLLFNCRSRWVGMNQILTTFYSDALGRDPARLLTL